MAYPLIILGAGASFGSVDIGSYDTTRRMNLKQWRPPLINGLFDRSRFSDLIEKRSAFSALVSDALTKIHRIGLEPYLQKILDVHSKGNVEDLQGLISLKYFLAELFNIISTNFLHTGYYAALLKEINHSGVEKTCFVNFNYDLLLEKNIPSIINSNSIESYIGGSIKVVKIHGACDWVYEPIKIDSNSKIKNAEEYLVKHANELFTYFDGKLITRRSYSGSYLDMSVGDYRYAYMPAIAIPVNNKHGHVCPSSHIEELKRFVSQADRVLIIGWRANDKFLLNLLQDCLQKEKTPALLIKGSNSDRESVVRKFAENVPKLYIKETINTGFGDFMTSGKCEEFLSKAL